MPRERGEKVIATNRRARHDYSIEKTYEAGLVLTGTEVKSLRQGRANLTDGYAYIDGGQAFLDAVHIPEYSQGHWTNHAAKRVRKLLLVLISPFKYLILWLTESNQVIHCSSI